MRQEVVDQLRRSVDPIQHIGTYLALPHALFHFFSFNQARDIHVFLQRIEICLLSRWIWALAIKQEIFMFSARDQKLPNLSRWVLASYFPVHQFIYFFNYVVYMVIQVYPLGKACEAAQIMFRFVTNIYSDSQQLSEEIFSQRAVNSSGL